MPKEAVGAGSWRGLHPIDAANLLASSEAPWWIAGGWALELFRGTFPRPHGDLDVGMLRRDVSGVLHSFSTWEVFEAKDGRLTRLFAGCVPAPDVHSVWCRPTAADPWMIELMFDEADGDTWVYRRDPRIRRPMSLVVRHTQDTPPYLAPEIQLLYKSKGARERDDVDFAQTWPLLAADARRWLHDALELTAPDHKWIAVLRGRDRRCNFGASELNSGADTFAYRSLGSPRALQSLHEPT